jgi:hypothetical protein
MLIALVLTPVTLALLGLLTIERRHVVAHRTH